MFMLGSDVGLGRLPQGHFGSPRIHLGRWECCTRRGILGASAGGRMLTQPESNPAVLRDLGHTEPARPSSPLDHIVMQAWLAP